MAGLRNLELDKRPLDAMARIDCADRRRARSEATG
jgi:hypothetical protein